MLFSTSVDLVNVDNLRSTGSTIKSELHSKTTEVVCFLLVTKNILLFFNVTLNLHYIWHKRYYISTFHIGSSNYSPQQIYYVVF